MICVTFALPEESRGFTRHLQHASVLEGGPLPVLLGSLPPCEIMVMHTGVGLERTNDAMHTLPSRRIPDLLVSTGFAGGLDPRLSVGDIMVAENYTDPGVMMRYLDLLKKCWIGELVTKAHVVEHLAERRSLLLGAGASAVDMETSVISAYCRMHGIPMLSLRVISDTEEQSLPMPFSVCFNARTQRPRPMSVARHLLNHPQKVPQFLRFVSGLSTARVKLGHFLARLLGSGPGAQ
jgi:adenosylhomocysteine nucleosidase